MKHCNVIFKPDNESISVRRGTTLLEAAARAGIILNSACGGKGICRKCLVVIEPEKQEVPACQYQVEKDIEVTIPDGSRLFEYQILTEGISGRLIEPDIYKKYLPIAATSSILGLAVDIGTTTVAATLIDMTDGRILATEADLNPQRRYGADVISRISYAETDEKVAELHKMIIDCVNDLIDKLCGKTGLEKRNIFEMCVVGNTTMNHLFCRLPVVQLGRAPYRPYRLDAMDLSPAELGLDMNPDGNVHTVENIAGFVGSDTTAVALTSRLDRATQTTLVVDIGTNGEIVLATKGRLYAASCAAGPALEGARITCGSMASRGAIEAVVVDNGKIELAVIGGGQATSICGSGLIDAVAVLLDLGILEATGRFAQPDKVKSNLPAAISSALVELDGQRVFVLAKDSDTGAPRVYLTQADIRQVQLAKGAIRAGIKLLQGKTGLGDDDIERILLAGAFGNYIRRESAIRIGLLPRVLPERITFIGNAAAAGARLALVSSYYRNLARQLARRIEYVEIAHEPDFAEVFAESMHFQALQGA